LVKKLASLIEAESSSPSTQQPVIGPILRQSNPFPHSHGVTVRYVLILSSHLRLSPKLSLNLHVFDKNCVWSFHFSHARCMSRLSQSRRSDNASNMWWGIQIM